ncbi:quinone-dependent dihydroorotate dehydrogenase [Wenzhouxiangella sp. EGI_FJ10409]|uniref:quinone-dependent dihydroorotate dehydrogenase n=1 Tax=Wenzhouxiangella sp. EGI_FJ10409 TaxID=3243767 RepID=UPI0035D6118E
MYQWLRNGLFLLPPETAHEVALGALSAGRLIGLPRLMGSRVVSKPVKLMGLTFPNPVGLAAGLDKNGDHIDALGQLGFGFIEVGTVTPKPQPGNPRPRMFRLAEHQALINRLGFNNKGVDHLVERLGQRRFTGIVGANIGKQKETPVEQAAADYRHCLEKVFPVCDYVTVNISSPNTANLRQLQDTGHLTELLEELTSARDELARQHGRQRPVLIKIAPDWDEQALSASLRVIGESGIDGLIATNTTLERAPVNGHEHANEVGGLSGAPLRQQADRVLRHARCVLGPDFPIIGLGGVICGDDAREKRRIGADLVQVYTGFIYRGPALIGECVRAWSDDAATSRA